MTPIQYDNDSMNLNESFSCTAPLYVSCYSIDNKSQPVLLIGVILKYINYKV